ncbi:serine hydrolase domain-containing protein [Leucobacter sp. M11]|uniref:serine hydrolase domain-containing protein n=1 Tax=Leucobacter sp. M11 TaxID=2993565 RepID=UPI002D80E18D|nr:serine hydrolase domain-containing protein [Leucobacter sp. M11]MEB4613126.1 serine hydrolase [Leucobacter sp. M11]
MHHTTPARPELSSRLHQLLLAGQIGADEPGAVIAVYRDGTLLASACAGLADAPGGAALSPDTMMNVASISKQMTAAAVLLAVRAGTLDLDADLRGLVPELQLSGVTLRNCLNHTAGLPDYLAVAYTVGMPEIEIAALRTFLDWLSRVGAHEFRPRERQSYSNTGYVLAAVALERAAGKPFPLVLAETVLLPLGMTGSFSTTVLGEFSAGMAFSFTRTDSGEFEKETMGVGTVAPVRGVNGDGEVITSLNEFGAWQGFLLDGRVLGEDIRQALLTKTVLTDGRETSYGFGIEHETRAHTTAYAHSGGMWGFSAYSIVDPATGISVACFSNRGGFRSSEAAWTAMHFASGFGDVAGHWYSTQTFMGAQLAVQADGNLAARTGLTEDAETAHWAGGHVWHGADDFARIEAIPTGLAITSWFGITDRYERVEPVAEYPRGLLGAYREPTFDAAYLFEERGDELWLVPPGREPERVLPFGRRHGGWIGETTLGWVLFDGTRAEPVRIGLGTYSTALFRAEREQ